jgi:hypothetical protein
MNSGKNVPSMLKMLLAWSVGDIAGSAGASTGGVSHDNKFKKKKKKKKKRKSPTA